MSRYGVKIAQQGIDISRAADYQMVLDSDWKFLDIYDEVDIDFTFDISTMPNGFYLFPIYTHSLSYVAGFEFFIGSKSVQSDGFTSRKWDTALQFLFGDSNAIYIQADPSLLSGRLVGKLRVFTINILDEYTAPSVFKLTAAVQPPGKYGAKFIDKTKGRTNIDSEDMEPFTLNTRGKQISIHKHGVVSADGSVVVKHDVGYPPSYMICKVYDGSDWQSIYERPKFKSEYQVGPLVTSFYLAKQLDANTLSFTGVQSSLQGLYSYIILKDPMEIAG